MQQITQLQAARKHDALKDEPRAMLLKVNGIKRFVTNDTAPDDIECINGFMSASNEVTRDQLIESS